MQAFGWWTLDAGKIASSIADFWVFVLPSFKENETSYIVIRPSELLQKYRAIHGKDQRIQSYLWVTSGGQCWETRGKGLTAADKTKIVEGTFRHPDRDFTPHLNNWKPLEKRLS